MRRPLLATVVLAVLPMGMAAADPPVDPATSTVFGEIRGFVFGPDGKPAQGTRIEAAPFPSEGHRSDRFHITDVGSSIPREPSPTAITTVGPSGAFRLESLDFHRRYHVSAVPSGTRCVSVVEVTAEPAGTEAAVWLEEGSLL